MENWQIITHILSFILGGATYHFIHKIKVNINFGNKGQSIQGSNVNGDIVQGDKITREEPKKKSRIRITAKLSDIPNPPAYTHFKFENGSRHEAFPNKLEKEGIVEWIIPNTTDNLFLCKQDFKEGGIFSIEEVD